MAISLFIDMSFFGLMCNFNTYFKILLGIYLNESFLNFYNKIFIINTKKNV